MLTIEGIGLCAPGLPDWDQGWQVLAGLCPYRREPLPALTPPLAGNQGRRASPAARLAARVAREALAGRWGEVAAVFACSGGDAHSLEGLCRALQEPGAPLSPSQFVNSVHNAPSGYWAIAHHSRAPTVSLAAYDGSFAAGLLEGATVAVAEGCRVLLIAYDLPPPPALLPFRNVTLPFAVALVLVPGAGSGPRLTLALAGPGPESRLADPELEALRRINPAARSLAVLEALARPREGPLNLPYLADRRLQVKVQP